MIPFHPVSPIVLLFCINMSDHSYDFPIFRQKEKKERKGHIVLPAESHPTT
jgi:hypothetical protein